jgi:hypothetical protein
VATIAPHDPAATTTLPSDVSTSLVTVVPPSTLAPDVSTTTLPAEVPPSAVPPATGSGGG